MQGAKNKEQSVMGRICIGGLRSKRNQMKLSDPTLWRDVKLAKVMAETNVEKIRHQVPSKSTMLLA